MALNYLYADVFDPIFFFNGTSSNLPEHFLRTHLYNSSFILERFKTILPKTSAVRSRIVPKMLHPPFLGQARSWARARLGILGLPMAKRKGEIKENGKMSDTMNTEMKSTVLKVSYVKTQLLEWICK